MWCGAKLGASGAVFLFFFNYCLCWVFFFARTILEKQDRGGEYKEFHIQA